MKNSILTKKFNHDVLVGSASKGASNAESVKVEPLPDLHDRVTEAYFGKMGNSLASSTRERVHWTCAHVEGTRVLDVGCSQGITAIILGREQKVVVGIDVAGRSIDEAREYLEMESREVQDCVTFIHGDFRTADLGQARFDTVIIGEVLEHVTKPSVLIETAAGKLAKNGALIVTVPFGINDWIDHKQTFYLLEPWKLISAHFDISEVRFFGKWIGFVGRKRAVPLAVSAMPPQMFLAQMEEAVQKLEHDLLERAESLSGQIRNLQAKLQSASDQSASLTKQASETEQTIKSKEEHIAALQAASRNQAERALELEKTIEIFEARIERGLAEKIIAERELARLSAELAAAQQLVQQHRSGAMRHEQSLERERDARVKAEKQLLLAEQAHQNAIARLQEAQDLLSGKTEEISAQTASLNQLKAERDAQANEIKHLVGQLDTTQASQAHDREQLKALEQLLAEQQQSAAVQHEQYQQSLERERTARTDIEKKALFLEQRHQEATVRLEQTEDTLRGKTEEALTLAARLSQLDTQRSDQDNALKRLTSKLSNFKELQSEIILKNEKIDTLTLSLSQTEAAAFEWLNALEQRTHELQRLGEKLSALQNETDGMRAATRQSIETLEREKTENIAQLAAALEEKKSVIDISNKEIYKKDGEINNLQKENNYFRDELDRLKRDHQAAIAATKNTQDQLSATNKNLETIRSALSDKENRIAQLQAQLQETLREKTGLQSRTQLLQSQLTDAKAGADRIKETISFRLGHALIFGFKSWPAFRSLPSNLVAIRNEARKRRALKTNKIEPIKENILLSQPVVAPAPLQAINNNTVPAQPKQPDLSRLKAKRPEEFKVAFIADEFTFNSYKDEFQVIPLEPSNWKQKLEETRPDILFCESAWSGADSNKRPWKGQIYSSIRFKKENRTALLDILAHCKKEGIPTAFWNKEDPSHYSDRIHDFVKTATEFDFIFTSAAECIKDYKSQYGVKNVFALPFATNPRLFNPVEMTQRNSNIVFAGSWYANHKERSKDMENILDRFLENNCKLDIYDRYNSDPDPLHKWPERYQSFLKPGVPHARIHEVYKSSRFGLNFNTVTNSSTMFARRVFELMSSNTLVISNYSRGIEEIFGDLVIFADRQPERLQSLSDQEVDQLRERALNLTLQEHTYSRRWQQILSNIGMPYSNSENGITISAIIRKREDALTAISWFQQHVQRIPNYQLLLVVDAQAADLEAAKLYQEFNRFGISVTSVSHAVKYSINDLYRPIETSYFALINIHKPPTIDWLKKAVLHLQYMKTYVIVPAGQDLPYRIRPARPEETRVGIASRFIDHLGAKALQAEVYCV